MDTLGGQKVDRVVGNKVEVTGMVVRFSLLLLRRLYVETVLAVGCALHSKFQIQIRENYKLWRTIDCIESLRALVVCVESWK
jgi:hypothetical protein